MTGEFLALDAIVEIPRGSRNIYELDPASACSRLDRPLSWSVHCPGDYGFVVGTKCADGNALHVLILGEEPTFPGCRVRVRPIGVFVMENSADDDETILAVSQGDPRFEGVQDRSDLPDHWIAEVDNCFAISKAPAGTSVTTGVWKGTKEACLAVARRWCGEHLEDNYYEISTDPDMRITEDPRAHLDLLSFTGDVAFQERN